MDVNKYLYTCSYSTVTLLGTFIHLSSQPIIWHLTTEQCIISFRYRTRDLVHVFNKDQKSINYSMRDLCDSSVLTVVCMFVPDRLAWVFQKLMISWEFLKKQYLEFIQKVAQNKKHLVYGGSTCWNTLLWLEIRGEWPAWSKLSELLAVYSNS